jgi:hypothetical protein
MLTPAYFVLVNH